MDDFWNQFERPKRVARKIDAPCEEEQGRIEFVTLGELLEKFIQGGIRVAVVLYAMGFWLAVGAIAVFALVVLSQVSRGDDMQHEIFIGTSQQSGKSNAVETRAAPRLSSEWSVVCVDPQHFATGWAIYKASIYQGQQHRTIFDDLGDSRRVILRDWLLPSKSPNYWERRQEDKNTVEMFLDPLARRRGLSDLDRNPLIKEWAEAWAYLMLHQKTRVPLIEGRNAFKPWLPSFKHLCENCTDNDIRWKFLKLPTTVSVLERMVNPAQRFLDPVLNSPAVVMRDGVGNGFDLESHLDNGGHYIIQGGANISREEIRFLLASVVLRVIEYKRRGGKRNVLLILEEAEAFDLVSTHEENAIKTLLKRGLVFLIVCQTPLFLDDE